MSVGLGVALFSTVCWQKIVGIFRVNSANMLARRLTGFPNARPGQILDSLNVPYGILSSCKIKMGKIMRGERR